MSSSNPPSLPPPSLSLSLSHTHTHTHIWDINPGSGFLLGKVINFPPFVEPEGSLHSLPQPAACPSPKPHESTLSFPTFRPTFIVPIYTLIFKVILSVKFPHQNPTRFSLLLHVCHILRPSHPLCTTIQILFGKDYEPWSSLLLSFLQHSYEIWLLTDVPMTQCSNVLRRFRSCIYT